MSDYLTRLAARALGQTPLAQPRLASLFEPAQPQRDVLLDANPDPDGLEIPDFIDRSSEAAPATASPEAAGERRLQIADPQPSIPWRQPLQTHIADPAD